MGWLLWAGAVDYARQRSSRPSPPWEVSSPRRDERGRGGRPRLLAGDEGVWPLASDAPTGSEPVMSRPREGTRADSSSASAGVTDARDSKRDARASEVGSGPNSARLLTPYDDCGRSLYSCCTKRRRPVSAGVKGRLGSRRDALRRQARGEVCIGRGPICKAEIYQQGSGRGSLGFLEDIYGRVWSKRSGQVRREVPLALRGLGCRPSAGRRCCDPPAQGAASQGVPGARTGASAIAAIAGRGIPAEVARDKWEPPRVARKDDRWRSSSTGTPASHLTRPRHGLCPTTRRQPARHSLPTPGHPLRVQPSQATLALRATTRPCARSTSSQQQSDAGSSANRAGQVKRVTTRAGAHIQRWERHES